MKSNKLAPELLVPGRRVTTDADILVIEGLSEPETVDNPAVPATIEVARQARARIERHRNGGGR